MATAFFRHAIPLLNLIDFIIAPKQMTMIIWEDNQATIKVIENGYSAKLAHVGRVHKVDIGSVNEQVCKNTEKYVTIKYCKTDDMCADIFTKALAPAKCPHALGLLGIMHDFDVKPIKESPIETDIAQTKARMAGAAAVSHTLYEPRCGAQCAANIVDDIVEFLQDTAPSEDFSHVTRACAAVIKRTKRKLAKGRPRCKAGGHLPGYGKLLEVCTPESSTLRMISEEFDGVEVIPVTEAMDLMDNETFAQVQSLIMRNPGISVHGSLPCTVWCVRQAMNMRKLGPDLSLIHI